MKSLVSSDYILLQRFGLVVKKQVLDPEVLGSNPASAFGEKLMLIPL